MKIWPLCVRGAAIRSQQRRYEVDATAAELTERYGFLVPGQNAEAEAWTLAGRLLSKRTMGKTIFADLADRTGRLQVYVRKEEVGEDGFADWRDLERGDIVGVRGYMFRSKMGELTLHVTVVRGAGKSADAAARQVARASRRREALSPALRRHDRQSRRARRR